MKFEIKSRFDGSVLFALETDSLNMFFKRNYEVIKWLRDREYAK